MATKSRWKITEEEAAQDALKCKTRSEFSERFSGSWRQLNNKRLLDKYCAHMTGNTIWTDEKVLALALTCKTRNEFKNTRRPYSYAKQHGLIKQCQAHMGPELTKGRKGPQKDRSSQVTLKQLLCLHKWKRIAKNHIGEYFKCTKCEKRKTVNKK
jgi:hypothetical protein